MFRNLEAEQARLRLTNQKVADILEISRVSYENKKKTGKFTTREIKKLCRLFKCKFDYLFAFWISKMNSRRCGVAWSPILHCQ